MFRKSVLIAFWFAATGCASSYQLPGAKFFSPENEGEKGTVQMGLDQHYNVEISSDTALVLVTNSTHTVDPRLSVNINGTYGVFPWLDVGITASSTTMPIYFLKGQVLGEPKRTADAGNFSTSLIAGVAPGTKETDKVTSGIFSTDSGTLEYTSDPGLNFGIQLGYRIEKQILLTLGLNGYWQSLEGSQVLSPSNATAKFAEKARVIEINWGGLLYPIENETGSKSVFVHPSFQYAQISTFGRNDYRFTYGLDLGYQF